MNFDFESLLRQLISLLGFPRIRYRLNTNYIKYAESRNSCVPCLVWQELIWFIPECQVALLPLLKSRDGSKPRPTWWCSMEEGLIRIVNSNQPITIRIIIILVLTKLIFCWENVFQWKPYFPCSLNILYSRSHSNTWTLTWSSRCVVKLIHWENRE